MTKWQISIIAITCLLRLQLGVFINFIMGLISWEGRIQCAAKGTHAYCRLRNYSIDCGKVEPDMIAFKRGIFCIIINVLQKGNPK